jgi:hypothetical protein
MFNQVTLEDAFDPYQGYMKVDQMKTPQIKDAASERSKTERLDD